MKKMLFIAALFMINIGCSRTELDSAYKFIPEPSDLNTPSLLGSLSFSYTPPDSSWNNGGYFSKLNNVRLLNLELRITGAKLDSVNAASQSNWTLLDRFVKQSLAKLPAGPHKPMIEQHFAQFMIQKSGVLNDTSSEAYAITKYYADLFVNSGGTNMGIYYYAFEKIKSKLTRKEKKAFCAKVLGVDYQVKQRGLNYSKPVPNKAKIASLSPKEAKLHEGTSAKMSLIRSQHNYFRNSFITQMNED